MRLLWALIVRDIKVRFKQTIGSYAWGIANPVLLMLVFTLFFGVLLEVPSYDVPYPVFVYTGSRSCYISEHKGSHWEKGRAVPLILQYHCSLKSF